MEMEIDNLGTPSVSEDKAIKWHKKSLLIEGIEIHNQVLLAKSGDTATNWDISNL